MSDVEFLSFYYSILGRVIQVNSSYILSTTKKLSFTTSMLSIVYTSQLNYGLLCCIRHICFNFYISIFVLVSW